MLAINDVFAVLPQVVGGLAYVYVSGTDLDTVVEVTVSVDGGSEVPCHYRLPRGSTTGLVVLLLYDDVALRSGRPKKRRVYGTAEVPTTITVKDSGTGVARKPITLVITDELP